MRVVIVTAIVGLLLVALLCWAFPAHAVIFISGSAAGGAPPADCPTGTYDFAWNGDHSSGTLYACLNSGISATQSTAQSGSYTISSDYGVTGNGIGFTGGTTGDDFIKFGGSVYDSYGSAGTVWLSVYPVASDTDKVVGEATVSGTNYFYLNIMSNDRIHFYFKATNAAQVANAACTVTIGAWNRIAYSWTIGGDEISVTNDGASWYTAAADFTAWPSAPSFVAIGWDTYGASGTDDVYVDDFYISDGYQAADPM